MINNNLFDNFSRLTSTMIYVILHQGMADVAQLVRALVCGTRCREFESHLPPHLFYKRVSDEAFFIICFRNGNEIGFSNHK